jgi:crotonobetainyl-CoA:carnitine CoA-transferase CaiB-like acyl-CoA transferase
MMAAGRKPTFLDGCLVVELGQRLGAGICGSLLAEAGADVFCVQQYDTGQPPHSKRTSPVIKSLLPGKQSLGIAGFFPAEEPIVADLIRRADVVIVSSDSDPQWPHPIAEALRNAHIVVDVTAFGSGAGPFTGRAYADPLIQALAGIMDTTGEPDGPPAMCEAPIIEMSAALYAASGAMAALRASRVQGIGQEVEVALYDTAVGMLATFLPKNFAGGEARRVGNHHPAMSPWNTFAARDGWVLLCAGTNDQWARVAKLIGKPELISDPRFDTTTKRVANAAECDATIAPWIVQFSVAECVDKLNEISISTGPIIEVASLAAEANLAHRGMIRTLADGKHRVPGSPLRGSVAHGVSPSTFPSREEGVSAAANVLARPGRPRTAANAKLQAPLAGIRVLEMGQFTTAPLVGRQLGALGADVVKLEPDGGEPAREMPPHKNDQGYFFSLSNSDTRVMKVDLRENGRIELLTELIAKADILVENTKPGTLGRHGFTPDEIMKINPRIVYCAISGFGIDAPSTGLGAMDTTIQGLAGIMDLTRVDGVPYKTGISIADLHAGQFALFATLAALEFRDRTGKGQYIDLAMLDAAAWVTRTAWNEQDLFPGFGAVTCEDGYLLATTPIGTTGHPDWTGVERARTTAPTRDALALALPELGIACAPVLSVSEVLAHPQTRERGLIFEAKARDGSSWNLLKCPITLSRTPAHVRRVPGALDADRDEIIRDWGLAWRKTNGEPS